MNTRLLPLTVLSLAAPGLAMACACGCGIFDVGTGSMYASHAGGMVFVEFDYLDQSHNYSGTSRAPAAQNPDKDIRSEFFTLGGQYQFNRSWGASVEVPYWQRYFRTTDAATGGIVDATHGAAGDIRIKSTYTGFSADMSSGLTMGLKLPNGDSSYPHFDPDTQIGSGSTDLLLGGYHLGRLTADNRWSYFLQGQWDLPLWHHPQYRPGAEAVVAAGAYFEGWSTHAALKFSPIAQLSAVYRRADGGSAGNAQDTGYSRLLISPGIEVSSGKARIYADVSLPLYTDARGNQLFADQMWKINASYSF